jgi:hypothetical protein
VKLETRSALILLFTLLLGLALGAVATGAAARLRADQLARMQRPTGFVEHMRQVIRPRDAAQWDSLRPALEATAQQHHAIRRRMHDGMRASLDSLRIRIAPLLDEEQRARLDDFARRPPPRPRGGPPPGPAGGWPPPPGGPP